MKVTIVFLLAMTSVLHGLDIGRILVDYQGENTHLKNVNVISKFNYWFYLKVPRLKIRQFAWHHNAFKQV